VARILIHSLDVIGREMAGPGIRSWELASALAENHTVILAARGQMAVDTNKFQTVASDAVSSISDYDVLLTQLLTPQLVRDASHRKAVIVLDAYDPVALEHLERHNSLPLAQRSRINTHTAAWQSYSLRAADAVICASERQRDLWLGALMTLGRITPGLYDRDRSLRSLIDVVPFGLPSTPPARSGPGPRVMFGLNADDFLVVWGGGIWEWLDPLSAIEGVASLSARRPEVKLVFVGLRHPNADVEQMNMAKRAVALAEQLKVKDRSVFFNPGWTPYDERGNYLLDADAGISTHFDHVEARFAFRTRMLDYIWAELPVVCTAGDSLADEIAASGIGVTVDFEAPDQIAAAIERLAMERDSTAAMRTRAATIRPRYEWRAVVRPLEAQIASLMARRPQRARKWALPAAGYYAEVAKGIAKTEGVPAVFRSAARYIGERQWRFRE
jgi:glycosyltransferase involved in cell wall biosynthesis